MVGVICIVVVVVLSALSFFAFNEMMKNCDETPVVFLAEFATFVLGIFGTVFAIIMTIAMITANSDTSAKERRYEMEQQESAIRYAIEHNKILSIEELSQIQDYNNSILSGRAWMESSILKGFAYDFWYDLEPIDLNENAEQVKQ